MTTRLFFFSLLLASSLAHAAEDKTQTKEKPAPKQPIWSTAESEKPSISLKQKDFGPSPGDEWKPSNKINYIVGGILSTGGDNLGELASIFGSAQNQTRKIFPGDNYLIYAGAIFPMGENRYRLHTSLGYSATTIDGKTTEGVPAEVTFRRYPIDIIPTYEFEKHSLGFGISLHINPTLSGGPTGNTRTINYKDALATLVNYQYHWKHNISVGVRYTEVDYRATNSRSQSNTGTTDAAHIGASIEYRF